MPGARTRPLAFLTVYLDHACLVHVSQHRKRRMAARCMHAPPRIPTLPIPLACRCKLLYVVSSPLMLLLQYKLTLLVFSCGLSDHEQASTFAGYILQQHHSVPPELQNVIHSVRASSVCCHPTLANILSLAGRDGEGACWSGKKEIANMRTFGRSAADQPLLLGLCIRRFTLQHPL